MKDDLPDDDRPRGSRERKLEALRDENYRLKRQILEMRIALKKAVSDRSLRSLCRKKK